MNKTLLNTVCMTSGLLTGKSAVEIADKNERALIKAEYKEQGKVLK